MAPKRTPMQPKGAAAIGAGGDDYQEEAESEVKADPTVLAMKLQIQALQETIQQLMMQQLIVGKQSTESKWQRPPVWDSDKEPDLWHKFKKILKSSLHDVGLQGARKAQVPAGYRFRCLRLFRRTSWRASVDHPV